MVFPFEQFKARLLTAFCGSLGPKGSFKSFGSPAAPDGISTCTWRQEGTGSACVKPNMLRVIGRMKWIPPITKQLQLQLAIGNSGLKCLNELVLVPLWLQISRAQPMNPRVPDVSECSRIGARQLGCAHKTFQGLVPSLGDCEKV